MTLPGSNYDMTGNVEIQDAQRFAYDSMLNTKVPSATQPYILTGTGAPTFTAPANSLYIRLDGSTTTTRLYVNTTGATTWATVTTSA